MSEENQEKKPSRPKKMREKIKDAPVHNKPLDEPVQSDNGYWKRYESRGRPSQFNEALTDRVIEMYKAGATDAEVAKNLGVSTWTINSWKNKYANFSRAINTARQLADDLVEAALFNRAIGYTYPVEKIFMDADGNPIRVKTFEHEPPNVAAQIFWLKNRKPELWREKITLDGIPFQQGDPRILDHVARNPVSFVKFAEIAGYPTPFPKQVEMRNFVMYTKGARLLLGSRGYGKTDYAVILGVAYEVYLDWFYERLEFSALITTKNDDRNKSIVAEIGKACQRNGVRFELDNTLTLRVEGLHGKDHSVEALPLKSSGFRGRHPKIVIMDDPVTPEDAHSPAARRKAKSVYDELMKLAPERVAIIGQPVHKLDLYQDLRSVINVMEVPHGSIPQLDADLEALKISGVTDTTIQASYHLKIAEDGSLPFSKIKTMQAFPVGDSVAFIDPSFTGGDYTAMTIVRGHFDNIATTGYAWKMGWADCLDLIVAACLKHGVRKLGFETNTLGEQPLSALRQVLGPHAVAVAGKYSSGNKHARIVNAAAYSENIMLAADAQSEYARQIREYEYDAPNDDAPDSLASCLEWIGLLKGVKK